MAIIRPALFSHLPAQMRRLPTHTFDFATEERKEEDIHRQIDSVRRLMSTFNPSVDKGLLYWYEENDRLYKLKDQRQDFISNQDYAQGLHRRDPERWRRLNRQYCRMKNKIYELRRDNRTAGWELWKRIPAARRAQVPPFLTLKHAKAAAAASRASPSCIAPGGPVSGVVDHTSINSPQPRGANIRRVVDRFEAQAQQQEEWRIRPFREALEAERLERLERILEAATAENIVEDTALKADEEGALALEIKVQEAARRAQERACRLSPGNDSSSATLSSSLLPSERTPASPTWSPVSPPLMTKQKQDEEFSSSMKNDNIKAGKRAQGRDVQGVAGNDASSATLSSSLLPSKKTPVSPTWSPVSPPLATKRRRNSLDCTVQHARFPFSPSIWGVPGHIDH